MTTTPDPLHAPVDRLFDEHCPLVLAVSGGLDSMCLLELVAARRPGGAHVVVATYDHRTSRHSAAAVRHVSRRAAALGLPVIVGQATEVARNEAAWRRSRWAFLRSVASSEGAVVVTAHTEDDHLETVVMRILRGAGARGLAGLLPPVHGVRRPLVGVSRAALERFATAAGVAWVEDPTNRSRRHLRNRVRLDLLPALTRARPALPDELRAIAARAAQWRVEVDDAVRGWGTVDRAGSITVDPGPLSRLSAEGRRVAWQALLAQGGVVLDRRGLVRLALMDPGARTGFAVPLSGGYDAVRLRGGIRVAPRPGCEAGECTVLEGIPLSFGGWRFRLATGAEPSGDTAADDWVLWLGEAAVVRVRAWAPGDRMRAGVGGAPRRVARFLADAGIAGPLRRGWPVVVADGEIIWIPGVRRAIAAAVRPGRPVRRLQCERLSS